MPSTTVGRGPSMAPPCARTPSGASSTVLYLEATPGSFNPATDLAISFTGANALTASDIIL